MEIENQPWLNQISPESCIVMVSTLMSSSVLLSWSILCFHTTLRTVQLALAIFLSVCHGFSSHCFSSWHVLFAYDF